MRIISIKSEDTDLSFSIGRHGENKTTAVIFDFSSWVNEFGDGVITCLVRRFLDKIAYPVILRVEDNCATWIVTSTDTAYVGAGQVEFTYTIGDQIVKSVVYKTSVLGDIGTPPVSPSEPYKDFLDALTEIEANTFKNAQDAQDAANEIVDMTVSAETLEAGSEATVEKTIVDNVINLNFGIPRGESGGGGVSSYSALPDKPQINGVTLEGNKTSNELGISANLTDDIKQALLNIFQVVAYTVSNPQDYYNALEDALYPKTLVSISATFTQGSAIIYDTDSLNELKQYLIVTANYDDNTSEIVNNYTLSGILQTGISTITVAYENKTTTFDVVVTHAVGTFSIANSLIGCVTSNLATFVTEEEPYSATITANAGYTLDGAEVEITMNEVDITSSVYSNGIITIPSVTGNLIITVTATVVALSSISAVYTQSKIVYTTDNLNSLKSDLVVTAHYSDSSEAEIASANYELSGALTVGTSIITVTYQNKTTTFNVEVTEPVVLSSISAVYTQTSTIYPDTPLTDLKNDLVVTATYSDSSTMSISPNDYTLSGTLAVGTSTVLVSYINKTTTFNVIVSERATLDSITAVYTQTGIVEENTPLNDLKADLVVTAYYSDNTSEIVPSTDYTLSGTLTVGISMVTVSYMTKTTTFSVTVSPAEQWEYLWIASESNHTIPSRMTTYGTPTWGTNDEYIIVTDPRLQGETKTSLIGDIVVEVEMKWANQGGYSAGSTLVVSSAEKTGCKLFLANDSGNINLYSCAEEGGNYTLKTISTNWDSFHKYRFELVGTLCKTYIDGTLVDTGYTYYSSWNGYPVIWSENQSSGRSAWDIKSIKYKRLNSSTIDGTDLTWTLGYINSSGNIDSTNISGANMGTYTSEEIDVSEFSTAIITNVSATLWRHAFYDSSHTFMSRVLTAEAEIPSGAKYDRVTIMNNNLGNNGYDGTGTAVTLK